MHFSLDFWNTIAIPNKTYAEERTKLLSEYIGIPFSEVKILYTAVKERLDKDAEEKGRAIPTHLVYRELCIAFGFIYGYNKMALEIENKFKKLFLELPPHIPSETVVTMRKLRSLGHTFSISSNTNFISGTIIRKAIEKYDLRLSFSIFSDLVGVSKPHPHFFDLVKTEHYLTFHHEMTNENACHIGDNAICDDPGDVMKHRIIKSPYELSSILREEAYAETV